MPSESETTSPDVLETWRIREFPAYMLVNAQGKILFKGPNDRNRLIAMLKSLRLL